jgi:hypothetical protein
VEKACRFRGGHTLNQSLNFVKPNYPKALLFLLITLLMPVPILIREPFYQFTNDYWIWKFQVHESLFTDIVRGYASSVNVFLGIVARDFFHNDLGIALLVAYYLAACVIYASAHRLYHHFSAGHTAS